MAATLTEKPAAPQCRDWDYQRGAKHQLRLLDACLDELENAHERDEVAVSAALAARLHAYVPSVVPGMQITQAIHTVFREQERYLPGDGPEVESSHAAGRIRSSGVGGRPSAIVRLLSKVGLTGLERAVSGSTEPPLDETAARALTDEIRKASQRVPLLLLEAHERYAWTALGYTTWEQYVRAEFGLSRSRSYELLDQGAVIVAIKIASCLAEMPDISAYAALQIKPSLRELLDEVRVRCADVDAQQRASVVAKVVKEFRVQLPRRRVVGRVNSGNTLTRAVSTPAREGTSLRLTGSPTGATEGWPVDPSILHSAIELLARMPPASDVVARIGASHLPALPDVEAALEWLDGFATACRRRGAVGPGAVAGMVVGGYAIPN